MESFQEEELKAATNGELGKKQWQFNWKVPSVDSYFLSVCAVFPKRVQQAVE